MQAAVVSIQLVRCEVGQGQPQKTAAFLPWEAPSPGATLYNDDADAINAARLRAIAALELVPGAAASWPVDVDVSQEYT